MPAISVQQVIAIIKGINFYSTPKKWYGVRPSDLFKTNLDLNLASTAVYPYIPGTGNPPIQTFTYATSLNTINNNASQTVKVIYNGGDISGNNQTNIVEEGLHKTGLLIQKKIK